MFPGVSSLGVSEGWRRLTQLGPRPGLMRRKRSVSLIGVYAALSHPMHPHMETNSPHAHLQARRWKLNVLCVVCVCFIWMFVCVCLYLC